MLNKTYILLGIIVFVGFMLRFFQLGDVPNGFHKDEAFLGYNGYSILKTGKDINGNFLPLHLQSFLYSPAGYSYASIPFLYLFDISAFSIRFASMFFGVLTIPLVFFITQILFKENKYKTAIAFVSTFLFAISPWHIVLSRTATENTLVVFFVTLGVFLYLKWLHQNKTVLLLSSFVSFAITLGIYQAPRAFLPLFIPLLIFSVTSNQYFKKNIKKIILLYFFLIILPVFTILNSKELSTRIQTVSVFATEHTQLVIDERLREDGITNTWRPFSRIFHNKVVGYSQQIVQNYFDHFSYRFLFTDNVLPKRYIIPGQGLLYLFELIFIIAGIYALVSTNKKVASFLIGWVLVAPIGSALTFDDIPNLQRLLIIFPALSIISAVGGVFLFHEVKKTKLFIPALSIFCMVFVFSFSYFIHQYFVHSNAHITIYRNEGYKDLVTTINAIIPSYKKAVITDRESSPTIFFLVYSKFNPSQFQDDTKNPIIPDFDRIRFNKYEFTQEECPIKEQRLPDGTPAPTGEKNVIYVNIAPCKDVPGTQVLSTIKRPDGTDIFKVLIVK